MEDDNGVVRTSVKTGCCQAVSIRYHKMVRHQTVDLGETAEPSPDYDYAVPTHLAHRAPEGREVVGRFASIREGLDYDYHGSYTVERQKLQDVIIGDAAGTGTQKESPWAIFTAGAMGAGKGHVMDWLCEQGYFPLPDVVTIDMDRFRCELPEWRGYVERNPGTAGYMTHRESGYMMEIAQVAAMETRKNVWIDGSLRDSAWYSQIFQQMRRQWPHYRIAIFHVTAPWETVMARAESRAKKTGRVVPEVELRASFDQVPSSVQRLAPLTDFTAHIENCGVPRLSSMEILGDPTPNTSGDWREVRDRFAVLKVLQRADADSEKVQCFVQSLIDAHPVIVFAKTYCSYCSRVEKILASELGGAELHVVELDTMTLEKDHSGELLDVEGDVGVVIQLALSRMTGQRLVPQVFLAGNFIGGCTEVLRLQEQGILQIYVASALKWQTACKH